MVEWPGMWMAACRHLVLDAVHLAFGFHLLRSLCRCGRHVHTNGMSTSLERSQGYLYLFREHFAARFAAMLCLGYSPRNLPRLRMHCAATPISEAVAWGAP